MSTVQQIFDELLAKDSALGAGNPIFTNKVADRSVRNVEEYFRFACRRTYEEMVSEIKTAQPDLEKDEKKFSAVTVRLIQTYSFNDFSKWKGIDRQEAIKVFAKAKESHGAYQRKKEAAQEKVRLKAEAAAEARKPKIAKKVLKRKRDKDDAVAAGAASSSTPPQESSKKKRVSFAVFSDEYNLTTKECSPKFTKTAPLVFPNKTKKRPSPKTRLAESIPEGVLSFTQEEDAACALMKLNKEALAVLDGLRKGQEPQ